MTTTTTRGYLGAHAQRVLGRTTHARYTLPLSTADYAMSVWCPCLLRATAGVCDCTGLLSSLLNIAFISALLRKPSRRFQFRAPTFSIISCPNIWSNHAHFATRKLSALNWIFTTQALHRQGIALHERARASVLSVTPQDLVACEVRRHACRSPLGRRADVAGMPLGRQHDALAQRARMHGWQLLQHPQAQGRLLCLQGRSEEVPIELSVHVRRTHLRRRQ
jgi:hypothetical protein